MRLTRLGWALSVGCSLLGALTSTTKAAPDVWRMQRRVQVDKTGAQRLTVDLDMMPQTGRFRTC